MAKKVRENLSVKIIEFIIVLLIVTVFANVVKLDMTGKTFFVSENISQKVGVSITEETIHPSRGTIYDSDGNALATDLTTYRIVFILSHESQRYGKNEQNETVLLPNYVEDPVKTASLLAPILGMDERELYGYLTQDDLYETWVGEAGAGLSYDTKCEIEELNLPGIRFLNEITRYYPQGSQASYLIGYTETDENGQTKGVAGIERILDEELAGKDGYSAYYSDPYDNPIAGGQIASEEYRNGYDVKLTLNALIQQSLEETLKNTMALSTQPDKAWGIVMNCEDGQIYGYASYPNYDANQMNFTNYADHNSQLVYEPGSVMKSFIYTATVDIGTFNKDDTFNNINFNVTEDSNGKIARVYNYSNQDVITNYNNFECATEDFYAAYCLSHNVGCAVLLEKYIDQDVYIDYIKKFGFLKSVNVYGVDELGSSGTADFDSCFSIVTTSFGQGISCNALQMMQAYTAIVNDGVMVKPYIIESISDPSTGTILYEGEKEELGQIISKETSQFMLMMMDGAVNSGYSSNSLRYALDDVRVGGKSGTAEVAEETGGYGSTTIHSMMLAMPIDDPKVLIYVCYQDDNEYAAQNISYVHSLEETVVDALNLAKQTPPSGVRELFENGIANYTNHSMDYVRPKVDELQMVLVQIGSGDTVIRQYPEQASTALAGNRQLVYTGGVVCMPDMSGWSRDEVIGFWQLTGIAVQMEGYGYVTSQNIVVDYPLSKDSVIIVTLN